MKLGECMKSVSKNTGYQETYTILRPIQTTMSVKPRSLWTLYVRAFRCGLRINFSEVNMKATPEPQNTAWYTCTLNMYWSLMSGISRALGSVTVLSRKRKSLQFFAHITYSSLTKSTRGSHSGNSEAIVLLHEAFKKPELHKLRCVFYQCQLLETVDWKKAVTMQQNA